jgi:N-glycosylase/DNA lyase
MTVTADKIIKVGQRAPGELLCFDMTDKEFKEIAVPYFSLDTDYNEIRKDIISHTDSDWLIKAADSAKGVVILKQEPWETLFSFIISQNNNIPRIRKIIKKICAEYDVNICVQNGIKKCPLEKTNDTPCDEICKSCGICYTFPTPKDVVNNPEKLLSSTGVMVPSI